MGDRTWICLMLNRSLCLLLPIAVSLLATPAAAVDIDWITIGNPGNAPDNTTRAAVDARNPGH